MSETDKIFKKIGFKILEDTDGIWYQKRNKGTIETVTDVLIDYKIKATSVTTDFYKEGKLLRRDGLIDFELLQAIIEKYKELGWIE